MSGLPIPGPSMRSEIHWSGGPVTERAWCLLAANPGPMTLDGTNTWILCEPGAQVAVVVDPGPDDPVHIAAVEAHVHDRGQRVGLILLTHSHSDHSGGAQVLHRATGAPVRAWRAGTPNDLADGECVLAEGLDLRIMATPGHSRDSVSIVLPADRALLTGDTVIGRGTTVVAWPDGNLGDYLDSLQRLRDASEDVAVLLPGHGPVLADPAMAITAYVDHRLARLDQVRSALASGARTAEEVVDVVYAGLDPSLRPAALLSTQAQVEYLGRA